jgi:hypothetical protein
VEVLSTEFELAVRNVTIHGVKRKRAIEAHTEVRTLLEADEQLCSWGIDTILIGSYARHTARYPGKDVDVFLRFRRLSVEADPGTVYAAVARVLIARYGEKGKDPGGRVTKQLRSLKVAFTDPDEPESDLSFSIDAVPAVPWGEHWGIPQRDTAQWRSDDQTERWVKTNPVAFSERSESLSTATWSPSVGGANAYCPIVRLLRQVRHVHLAEERPGGLFTEVVAFYAWSGQRIVGSSWAELMAGTLREVADAFSRAAADGLTDPVLQTPMKPELATDAWLGAADKFRALANAADTALNSERCQAAKLWRDILGSNDRGEVLPLPSGCDANGFPLSAISVTAVGSDEPRGFA